MSITLLVLPGNSGVVHLTEAVEETEYKVQYALSKSVAGPESMWADLYVQDELLVLTPKTTPLLLNLPGAYRIIVNSPSSGTLSTQTWPAITIGSGDVR